MALGCGTTLVKYILFLFNFLIALGGIVLITFGVMALIGTNDFQNVFDKNSPAFAAISLIVFGSVVFLIAFFGCCGAIRESHCLTMTYASILLILIIGQIVIAVLVFVRQHDYKEDIMKIIERIFQNPSQNPNMDTINGIQTSLSCCGFNSVGDWNGNVPASCCAATVSQCSTSNAFSSPCNTAFRDWMNFYGDVLAWIAIGVAVIELVALVFACCLGNNIRNAERRYA